MHERKYIKTVKAVILAYSLLCIPGFLEILDDYRRGCRKDAFLSFLAVCPGLQDLSLLIRDQICPYPHPHILQ